jgi:hexosaminidase
MDRKAISSLSIDENLIGHGAEAYRLAVSRERVIMDGASPAGLMRAAATFLQMVPVQGKKCSDPEEIHVHCAEILDYPRFPWRGMNLDCSRHFMTVDFVKRYINLLALYKMNILHWHLTDDQGWRPEIKRYSRLSSVGAWRRGSDGSAYGGFYTREDMEDIISYASGRSIEIVPEIDLPGHCAAALASYPELSCSGSGREVECSWGIFQDVYCAGKEEAFTFLENVFDEIMDVFPGRHVHIGGDECVKDRWRSCPLCQERMRREGLRKETELQGWFMKRIAAMMKRRGRTVIGWDEILECGAPGGALVQSWRGSSGATEAARAALGTIVSPFEFTYFDYPVSRTSLEKVYSFDPVPSGLEQEYHKFILGTEACMWTERAPQDEVDDRMFPRLLALAETAWSPPERRDFPWFRKRVRAHYPRLEMMGVSYGKEEGDGLSGALYSLRIIRELVAGIFRRPGRTLLYLRRIFGR